MELELLNVVIGSKFSIGKHKPEAKGSEHCLCRFSFQHNFITGENQLIFRRLKPDWKQELI